jgi:hypothetical protein
MNAAPSRFVALGVALLWACLAVLAAVACSSSSSGSSSSATTCDDAGPPPDGSCGATVAEIRRNGGSKGVCANKDPSVVAKFGVACGALANCSQCTTCDLAACDTLFGVDAGP